jgi:hypothetical protein
MNNVQPCRFWLSSWLLACVFCFLASPRASGDVVHTAAFNGHTYHLLDTNGAKWWLASEAEAIGLGGHLVTINDAVENQWVFDTFAPVAINYANANNLPDRQAISLWIGLSDHLVEGNFVWASGEPVGYTNWAPGEPAGGGPDEDFAGISVNLGRFTPGTWHDIVGNTRVVDLPFGVVEVVPEPSSIVGFGLPSLWLATRRRFVR